MNVWRRFTLRDFRTRLSSAPSSPDPTRSNRIVVRSADSGDATPAANARSRPINKQQRRRYRTMRTNPFYDTWLFLIGNTPDHAGSGARFLLVTIFYALAIGGMGW